MSHALMQEPQGPLVYENWREYLAGKAWAGSIEFPLFTDAHITGEVKGDLGPYQLHNAVPMFDAFGVIQPSILLRMAIHKPYDFEAEPPMDKTDYSRYHGGRSIDEVAALISFCLGIRLKAGGQTRSFDPDSDPMGRPEAFESSKNPVMSKPTRPVPVVPTAIGTHSLDATHRLARLPELKAGNATALVRAARLYQDAIWLAESEPALAWLIFVSAIETAAQHWRMVRESPLERLHASKPDLESLLRQYGDERFAAAVADMIAPYMGATKTFIDFMLEFAPAPPPIRPTYEWMQFKWERSSIKKAMGTIYDYRSKALHGGYPFPASMCVTPLHPFAESLPEEVPIGLAMRTYGGTWLSKDTPMLLHTFEYFVRGSLLRWYESMLPLESAPDHVSQGAGN